MAKKINFNDVFKNIDAIIYDLDGTLVDSMWIWERIDIDYLSKRQIDLPEDLSKAVEGMSFDETAKYFKKRFHIEESIEMIQKEWNEMAYRKYNEEIKTKAGVKRFLQEAHDRGIKMGIGTSNSPFLLETVIKSNQIEDYFQAKRTSCEVKKGKPSPDIFLKVAEDLGVKPEKCFVFEDTHAGVKAGRSAGMKVIAVYDALSAPYKEEIEKDADIYIESFEAFSYE